MKHLAPFFPLFFCMSILAHGVEIRVRSSSYGVQFFYDDGSPMSHCDVEVFEKGKDEVVYSGTTDPQGCFAMVPEHAGHWIMRINDGMGHGQVHEFEIGEEVPKVTATGFGKGQKVLIGLSVLFGLTGIATFAASKRSLEGG